MPDIRSFRRFRENTRRAQLAELRERIYTLRELIERLERAKAPEIEDDAGTVDSGILRLRQLTVEDELGRLHTELGDLERREAVLAARLMEAPLPPGLRPPPMEADRAGEEGSLAEANATLAGTMPDEAEATAKREAPVPEAGTPPVSEQAMDPRDAGDPAQAQEQERAAERLRAAEEERARAAELERLEAEHRAREEAERARAAALARLEREQQELQRLAELERLERERLEHERAERLRVQQERAERLRAEQERAEQERAERERAERERAEIAERARRAEMERQAELERLAELQRAVERERAARERLEEQERLERERAAQLELVATILAPTRLEPAAPRQREPEATVPPPADDTAAARTSGAAPGGALPADVLRAVGWFLDQEDATSYSIVTEDTIVKVTWETVDAGVGRRAYQEHQLESLRARARAMRRQRHYAGPSANSELLRTIGQILERERITTRGIFRDAEGFRISGLADRKFVTKLLKTKDLLPSSVGRQSERGEQDPFVGVAVGLPVVTSDGVGIGTVQQTRSAFFQVGRRRFGGRFWLPAATVAACGDGRVLLTISNAQLDLHKVRRAPPPDR